MTNEPFHRFAINDTAILLCVTPDRSIQQRSIHDAGDVDEY